LIASVNFLYRTVSHNADKSAVYFSNFASRQLRRRRRASPRPFGIGLVSLKRHLRPHGLGHFGIARAVRLAEEPLNSTVIRGVLLARCALPSDYARDILVWVLAQRVKRHRKVAHCVTEPIALVER
jgi:hypothetical protein